ncbi:hypothetical protein CF326_g3744 [Tilletia indica]|nr:hypothetical protein CF326_g3744 [Tilletia indica]
MASTLGPEELSSPSGVNGQEMAAVGNDGSDACSITSDYEAPTRVVRCSPPSYIFRTTPASEPLRPFVEDIVQVCRVNPVVESGVFAVMMLGACALEYKFLKHDALAYCTRVLKFYKQLDISPSRPGTVLNMSLNNILALIKEHKTRLIEQVMRYRKARSLSRSYTKTSMRLVLISALKAIKIAVHDAQKALGLVSKSRRIAFSQLYDPKVLPLFHPSLRKLYETRLRKVEEVYFEKSEKLRGTFPDMQAYNRLYSFLRNMHLHQEDPHDHAEPQRGSRTNHSNVAPGAGNHADEVGNVDGSESIEHNGDEEDWPPDEDEEDQLTPDTYSLFIWQELDPQRMAFTTLEELSSWRDLGDLRTGGAVRHLDWGRNTLAERNPHQLLAFLLIETSKMECFEQAATMADLLVIVYRHRLKENPTAGGMMDLAMALGALGATLTRTESRQLEGIRAIEEAMRLIASFKDLLKNWYPLVMSFFRTAYCHALLVYSYKLNSVSSDLPLSHSRRALRSARAAVDDMRTYIETNPPNCTGGEHAVLARALFSCAFSGRALLEEMEAQQSHHHRCDLGNSPKRAYSRFRQEPRMGTFAWENWCDEELRTSEREYVHSKLADYSLGNVKDFATFAEEAVGLYEDLVKTNREQYEPLLAETLFLHARLLDLLPDKAIPVCEEAIETYERISSTFIGHFKDQLAELYLDLARHLRQENDMVKLPSALDEALIHQEALEYRFSIWRGYDTVASLNSARALVHAHLEEYDEALAVALTAEQKMNAEVARHNWMKSHLLEPKAVKGFAFWMLGQPEQALAAFTSAMELIYKRAEESKGGLRRRHYRASKDPRYMLISGWTGGVRAALGDLQGARQDGESAVQEMRRRLKALEGNAAEVDGAELEDGEVDDEDRYRLVHDSLEPIDRILPHILLILAATLARLGELKDAMDHVDEVLERSKMYRCRDESTVKTALLLKLRLLQHSSPDDIMLIQQIQTEGEAIPMQGFLVQLRCSEADLPLSAKCSDNYCP